MSGIKALLVEDNPINQDVASHMLENLGCRFTVVDNGSKAIEKWQHEAFDLIFMDCYMPVMDGYAATRAIREIEAARSCTPDPDHRAYRKCDGGRSRKVPRRRDG